MKLLRANWVLWTGFALILIYWLCLAPPGYGRLGYAEDLGGLELGRQILAENLIRFGRPAFWTDRVMAPTGISVAFYSWAIERDWIGAYLWMWNRDFPWLWVYFLISMSISFFGVGFILRKMKLSKPAAWGLATFVVLFNVPRHYKIYYHYEHLIQHWAYLGFFLDAWIWQKVWRDRKWSWTLELWRGLVLLATFNLGGYYWGAMCMEWLFVRACLVAVFLLGLRASSRHGKVSLEGQVKQAFLPLGLCATLLTLDLRWFPALISEVAKFGNVSQNGGWVASFKGIFRPVWIETALAPLAWLNSGWFENVLRILGKSGLSPIDDTETVVTIGWAYYIPAGIILWRLRRKQQGPGVGLALPFLLYFAFACVYIKGAFFGPTNPIPYIVPFMKFFRVASRMGLFLPMTVGSILALGWPELTTWVKEKWVESRLPGRSRFRYGACIFVFFTLLEFTELFSPVKRMPEIEPPLLSIVNEVRASPGTTVLDLPFCVAGANGVCTSEECPNYPWSAAALSLTGYHEKKVYGVYEARLAPFQCELYNRPPYTSWFNAWREQRCFNPPEWKDFCGYLDEHKELSAVFVYPEIWNAVATPQCRAEFDRHLGPARGEAQLVINIPKGMKDFLKSRLLWYATKCVAQ